MSLLIVGSGLGGYLLLKELREQGYDGAIELFTGDDGAFYSKPQISNALGQNKTADQLVNIGPEAMQAKYEFKLHSHTVVDRLDPDAKVLSVGDRAYNYSNCVLALGAKPVSAPWDEFSFKINNLVDYQKFRAELQVGKIVAIVGSGLVGCELAADLAVAGYDVHLFSIDSDPIARFLPKECGAFLKEKMIQAGVNWHYIDAFAVKKSANRLLINDEFSADILISALGIRPEVALAEAADLAVQDGIVVDDYCQTSAKSVYALGDCANVNGANLAYVAPIRQCVNVLTGILLGQKPSPINYPIMPVILKTPMCRTIFVHSNFGHSWDVSGDDSGMLAKQFDAEGNLRGFVIMGTAAKHRAELMQACIK